MEILDSFRNAMRLLEWAIEGCGGEKEFFFCDHSVGICACKAFDDYEKAKQTLKRYEKILVKK